LAIVLGEDELARGVVQLKPLREGAGAPAEVKIDTAVSAVDEWLTAHGSKNYEQERRS